MKSDQQHLKKPRQEGHFKKKTEGLLHRERKENATNTRRLEIQKVIVFTNINILVVFIHSNQVVEFKVHQMMQLFHSFLLPHLTVVFVQEHQVLLHVHHAPYQIITQMCTPQRQNFCQMAPNSFGWC
jgi:hypothetical protein